MSNCFQLGGEVTDIQYYRSHPRHGFGLPHTDEDPYNENLGNCLDYTKDPGGGGNLYPGAVNLKKLKSMYLSRRKLSSSENEDGSVIETHMLVVDPSMIEDYESYEEV
jgi:hypothetical protein